MYRLALLLAVTGGCNAVFGIDDVPPIATVCGPYAAPVPVVFDGANLAGAYDLSLDETATHGIVRVGSGPHPMLYAVVFMADGTYAEDTSRDGNLGTLRGTGLFMGHVTAITNHNIGTGMLDANVQADMFGAVLPDQSSDYQIQHFEERKSPAGWVLAEGTAVDDVPGQSAYPGNEVEIPTGVATAFTRYVTVVHVDDATLTRTLDIDKMFPDSAVWVPELNKSIPVAGQVNSVHAVQQAVLAYGDLANPALKLVYNATVVGSSDTTLRVYASPKTADGYAAGTPVSIDIEPGDILEPWVNPDCSTLWFRRDATVYRADAR